MGSVASSQQSAALAGLRGALAAVREAGIQPADSADARAWLRDLGELGNQVRSIEVGLVDQIDQRGLHKADGHASAKVLVRHVGHLSDAEAGRRHRMAKVLRHMPEVAKAFELGLIGADQVWRIARTYANPRVRSKLVAQDPKIVGLARKLSYKEFDERMTVWEALMDEDGTCDRAQRTHENRDFVHRQNFDGSWEQSGGCSSLVGAEINAILEKFEHIEFLADWDEARRLHGDQAVAADLPRTPAQRRADAFYAMATQAADAHAASAGGSQIITNIVVDEATFERWATIYAGADVEPLDLDIDLEPIEDDPVDAPSGDREPSPEDGTTADTMIDTHAGTEPGADTPSDAPAPSPDDERAGAPARGCTDDRPSRVGYRCSTLDGDQVHPAEVVAHAMVHHIRRVVVNSAGVTIDLGRRRRLFTGSAQLAVRLSHTTCFWPGCEARVSHTQTDHTIAWANRDGTGGGHTKPDNGGPGCPRHNRHKELGYRVHRDAAGGWHVFRPDGTEIE